MSEVFTRKHLEKLEPKFEFFVGVDSDGCIFDTMESKQKKCFHPAIVEHWNLEPIGQHVREAAEFVNLYSRGRGRNRFLCLVDTFDLLNQRRELMNAGVDLPRFQSLKRWIAEEPQLGNPTLEAKVADSGDAELKKLLAWSLDVNDRVESLVDSMPPFDSALKGLKLIAESADVVCVSQTPTEALLREWRDSDITQYVSVIAGQELGTKTEHLRLAAGGKYDKEHVIMIGDAPGDLRAARENDALFFPIMPGSEEESWQRFCEESFTRFLDGRYAGDYEAGLVQEFEEALPEQPPWKR